MHPSQSAATDLLLRRDPENESSLRQGLQAEMAPHPVPLGMHPGHVKAFFVH